MPASDGTLVLGVLSGDRDAFAELYDRRARLIRAVCYDATRDVEEAADLTQEVFLRAYENLGRLRDPDCFAAWLVSIARRVCSERRRKRRHERRGLAVLSERKAASPPPADPPEQRLVDLRDQIASLTGRGGLSERERLALHAFYLQERDVEQARRVLGLSRSGFYRVLSSACERLRRASGKREVHR